MLPPTACPRRAGGSRNTRTLSSSSRSSWFPADWSQLPKVLTATVPNPESGPAVESTGNGAVGKGPIARAQSASDPCIVCPPMRSSWICSSVMLRGGSIRISAIAARIFGRVNWPTSANAGEGTV